MIRKVEPGVGTAASPRPSALPALWVASVAREPRDSRSLDLIGAEEFSPSVSRAPGERIVLFDGVLYNRAELIVQLDGGASLNDADVVLRAYERWGLDLPHRIKGIFALVIVDSRDRLCFAVRDPLGAYPLFFAETGDRLLLSTSIETIRSQPARRALPILVISGNSDPDTPSRLVALGADAYFPKPFSPAEVRSRLEQLIHAS